MDPRTAAKVTSADLVQAFDEGRGVTRKVNRGRWHWRVEFWTGKNQVRIVFYDDLDALMPELRAHLMSGPDRSVAVDVIEFRSAADL